MHDRSTERFSTISVYLSSKIQTGGSPMPRIVRPISALRRALSRYKRTRSNQARSPGEERDRPSESVEGE
jgi:hypothetical protein